MIKKALLRKHEILPVSLVFIMGIGGKAVSAQTIYEAEAGTNTRGGSAIVGACAPCSGGKNVQYLGGPGKGTLSIPVSVSQSGQFQIAITYDNEASANLPAAVTVNGAAAATVPFATTGSWNTLATATVTVSLRAGVNNVAFASAGTNYVAEIDKITIRGGTPSPTPSPTPTPTPTPTPAPTPTPTNTVPLSSFGSAGKGGDDTAVFQNALNSTAANSETLEVPAASVPYNVRPLTIPSNAKLLLDAGVIIQATSGYSTGQRMINIVDVSNVSISGTPGKSIFQMRKSEYSSGEYRHCLDIEGANNVQITGIQCNNSGGDGLYIGEGNQGFSNNVTVSNSGFDNNRRQGFSLISGKNITISGCTFTNTVGTAPQDGIDIEPNSTNDLIQNVSIVNSSASGNSGDGLSVSLWNSGPSQAPISVTVSNFRSSRNARNGIFASNEHDDGIGSASGTVTINDSSSQNDGAFGAVASYWDVPGTQLIFNNMVVNSPNQYGKNEDGAAIGIRRGGGDGSYMGNVTFNGPSVSDSTGRIQNYFTINDYSSVGLKNIHINSVKSLQGAPSGTPLAILNGSPTNQVQVN